MSNKNNNSNRNRQRDQEAEATEQLPLFETLPDTKSKPVELKLRPKKAKLPPENPPQEDIPQISQGIPQLKLPPSWERLQTEIEDSEVSLHTIIRPVPQAITVVRNIIEYLRTTRGCQVLVIRADTGSGKTTFLNTLPHYMQDVDFHIQTIDIQPHINTDDFGKILWDIKTYSKGINVIILEGREEPESIDDKYIQIVLANINRFSRTKKVPLLFVIPTIEEQVARNWCDHGTKIGDLIPEQNLYQGSRWYNFPGVPKEEYIDVAEKTVRALNPPYTLYEFGVSSDEVKSWVNTAPTIGKFIEILANRVSNIRAATSVPLVGN